MNKYQNKYTNKYIYIYIIQMCLCVCSLCRPKCIQYVYVCVYENVSISLTAPVYVVGVWGVYIYIHMVFGRVE